MSLSAKTMSSSWATSRASRSSSPPSASSVKKQDSRSSHTQRPLKGAVPLAAGASSRQILLTVSPQSPLSSSLTLTTHRFGLPYATMLSSSLSEGSGAAACPKTGQNSDDDEVSFACRGAEGASKVSLVASTLRGTAETPSASQPKTSAAAALTAAAMAGPGRAIACQCKAS